MYAKRLALCAKRMNKTKEPRRNGQYVVSTYYLNAVSWWLFDNISCVVNQIFNIFLLKLCGKKDMLGAYYTLIL